MIKNENANCECCGGTNFYIQNGFYFCYECNVQSQDFREQVGFKANNAPQIAVETETDVSIHQPASQEDVKPTKQSCELTSWEALNYILKGIVDELILIGMPNELKIISLQLWCTYLRKIEVAFINKEHNINPRLGVAFRRRDAEIIYDLSPSESSTQKFPIKPKVYKKRARSSVDSKSSGSTATSLRSERYRLTKRKRDLAKSEYNESQTMGSQTNLETFDALNISDPTSTPPKANKIRQSKYAKVSMDKAIRLAIDMEDSYRNKIQLSLLKKESKSIRNPTLAQLIVIIKLALNILEEDVCFSDIMRWDEEGYLSIRNAEKCLPFSVNLARDNKYLLSQTLNSYNFFHKHVITMGELIQAEVNTPLRSLVKRYIKELNLPDDLEIVINNILKNHYTHVLRNTTAIEAIAMALVLFSLKLLFGLDDVTEKNLSNFAEFINRDVKAVEEEGEQFSFREWTRFINARTARLAKLHHPTNYRYYRGMTRNEKSDTFLSQWDMTDIAYLGLRKDEIDDKIGRTLEVIFGDLICPLSEPKIKASTTPLFSFNSSIGGVEFNRKSLSYLIKHDFREKMLQQFYSGSTSYNTTKQFRFSFKSKMVQKENSTKKYAVPRNQLKSKLVRMEMDDENFLMEENTTEMDDDDNLSANETTMLQQRGNNTPGKYWRISYNTYNHYEEEFQLSGTELFPVSFWWLLNACSKAINVSTINVYRELILLEKKFFV